MNTMRKQVNAKQQMRTHHPNWRSRRINITNSRTQTVSINATIVIVVTPFSIARNMLSVKFGLEILDTVINKSMRMLEVNARLICILNQFQLTFQTLVNMITLTPQKDVKLNVIAMKTAMHLNSEALNLTLYANTFMLKPMQKTFLNNK